MNDAFERLEELELMGDDEAEEAASHGGTLRVAIGVEAFFDASNEDAKRYIEQRRCFMREDVERIDKRIEELKKVMDGLRTALYARFGANNINLEYEKL